MPSMGRADRATAQTSVRETSIGVVTNADEAVPIGIEPAEYAVEEICFTLLAISPRRVCAHVRHLHHAGELAVHKERSLHDEWNLARPSSSPFMEVPHELRQPPHHGLVLVLQEKTMLPSCLSLEIAVKPGYNLFERLFVRRHARRPSSECRFVGALCEEAAVVPAGNETCEITQKLPSFVQGQVDVCDGLHEVLPVALHCAWPLGRGLRDQEGVSGGLRLFPTIVDRQLFKIWNPFLLPDTFEPASRREPRHAPGRTAA